MKINSVTMTGRLGADSQSIPFGERTLTKFAIYVETSYKKGDEWVNDSFIINCECWKPIDSLPKGQLVAVTGSLESSKYNGQTYFKIDVRAVFKIQK